MATRRKWCFAVAATAVLGLAGCSTTGGSTDAQSTRLTTPSAEAPHAPVAPTTSVAGRVTAPKTGAASTCDRGKALAAVVASGGAKTGGHIDYLKCSDGFGWALYNLPNIGRAHVILSIGAGGYKVLNLGGSLCPLDSGMPADVAMRIAPTPAAATDCPSRAAPETADRQGDHISDDEGHQPWRAACVEDPGSYPGC